MYHQNMKYENAFVYKKGRTKLLCCLLMVLAYKT